MYALLYNKIKDTTKKVYYFRKLLAVHDSSCAVTSGCSYSLLVHNVGTYTFLLTPDVERAR